MTPSLSYVERGDRSGDDAPVLILLPGPTDSWVSYEQVLDRLPPSVRAVAVSLRGHGDSEAPASGYGVEDLASDVVPLLDRLGIARAVIAGHSGSCLVARRVALDSPHRVAGLVLEASPTTLRGDTRLRSLLDAVLDGLTDPIDADFARSWIVDTSSDVLPPALVARLVAEVRKVRAPVWREMFAALVDYDDTAELARIGMPSLLVWGDADTIVDRAAQEQLVASLPDAELVVYPGVGHTPRWDDPARFAADVAAFVAGRA